MSEFLVKDLVPEDYPQGFRAVITSINKAVEYARQVHKNNRNSPHFFKDPAVAVFTEVRRAQWLLGSKAGKELLQRLDEREQHGVGIAMSS